MLKYSLIAVGLIVATPFVHAEIPVGSQTPCLTLAQLDPSGQTVQQTTCKPEVAGKKIVLEFFATTCEYCVENLPEFTKLAGLYSDIAEFRIVGYDSDPKVLDAYFAKRDHSKFSIAADPQMTTLTPFDVQGTPDLFIIGADGIVQMVHLGTVDGAADEASVIAAIKQ